MKYFLLLFSVLFSFGLLAQTNKAKADEIAKLINAYRTEKKLPPLAYSNKLTEVAELHALDLMAHPPKGDCNMHSWSNQEKWQGCCYTSDHKKASCMWNKPKEINGYSGQGFEIAHWSSDAIDPTKAVEGWKKSPGHNMVMVNVGIWKDQNWEAMGVGVSDNYAVVWFGKVVDE